MINCSFSGLNGLNKNCELFLSATKGFAVTDPDQYFASLTAAKTLSNFKTAIDTSVSMWLPRPILSSEPTAAEPVIETDGFGRDRVTGFNPPKATFYLSSSPCDFKEMQALGAQMCRMYLFGQDGSKMGWQDDNGVIRGFECQYVAQPISVPGRENKLQQFKVIVNFSEVDEFENFVIWNDGISYNQYLEFMPEGYTMEVVAALSGTAASVKLYKRCQDTVLGVDTFVAEIVDSNCPLPSITVGAITGGISVLTVYATGTTPLASGQYVTFRLVKKTTTVYDQISNYVTFRIA